MTTTTTKKPPIQNKALWGAIAAVAIAVAAGYGVDLQGAFCPEPTPEPCDCAEPGSAGDEPVL